MEVYLRSSETLPVFRGGGIVNYAHVKSQSNLKVIFSVFEQLSVAHIFYCVSRRGIVLKGLSLS